MNHPRDHKRFHVKLNIFLYAAWHRDLLHVTRYLFVFAMCTQSDRRDGELLHRPSSSFIHHLRPQAYNVAMTCGERAASLS